MVKKKLIITLKMKIKFSYNVVNSQFYFGVSVCICTFEHKKCITQQFMINRNLLLNF